MAITLSARREGVSSNGKRTVTYTVAFSDGSADNVTNATLGLHRVDDVYVVAASSGGTGVDVTANDGTNVTLDPVAAATLDIIFEGY
jgi:hypothetical protein